MSLVRPLLPASLPDNRALPDLVGKPVRLAALLSSKPDGAEGASARMLLEDEWGTVEVTAAPGREGGKLPPGAAIVLVEGQVEERYGVPVIVAAKLETPLPGPAAGVCIPRDGKRTECSVGGPEQGRLREESKR
jgi:hypothetical protein